VSRAAIKFVVGQTVRKRTAPAAQRRDGFSPARKRRVRVEDGPSRGSGDTADWEDMSQGTTLVVPTPVLFIDSEPTSVGGTPRRGSGDTHRQLTNPETCRRSAARLRLIRDRRIERFAGRSFS